MSRPAPDPCSGERYRHKGIPRKVVEVESVLRVRDEVSVEFCVISDDVGLVPQGFARSLPMWRFLDEYELDGAPAVGAQP